MFDCQVQNVALPFFLADTRTSQKLVLRCTLCAELCEERQTVLAAQNV